jgi:hypothetical protein
MIFDKETKGEMTAFLTNRAEATGDPSTKLNVDTNLTAFMKINSKLITDIRVIFRAKNK